MLAESPKSVRVYEAMNAAKAFVDSNEGYPVRNNTLHSSTSNLTFKGTAPHSQRANWAHEVARRASATRPNIFHKLTNLVTTVWCRLQIQSWVCAPGPADVPPATARRVEGALPQAGGLVGRATVGQGRAQEVGGHE